MCPPPERHRSGRQVALFGALLARAGQRDMRPNTHLRQALAQLIGGAFTVEASAITGRERVPALRPRGRPVEHAQALSTLDALELRNGGQRVRRAEEEVLTAIYLAMQQFLGSTGGGIAGLLLLGLPDPSSS